MLIFSSANDSHADTIPFIKNLQSSFPLPDFTATSSFLKTQTREKNTYSNIEKKESQMLENIHSHIGSFSRAIGNYMKPILRTLNGSSHIEQRAGADIRSAVNRMLSFSFGESVSTGNSLSPEDAIRIRQKSDADSESAIPFSSDTVSELNVNAPSLFKEQTQFQKDIFLDGNINAEGGNVNLGLGTLTAGNVLYGLVAGDGISLSGIAQRPTISSLFWRREEDRIRTQEEGLSLALDNLLFVSGAGTSTFGGNADIAENLTVGNTLFLKKGLHFSGDVTLQHDGTATILIPNALPNAWRIATSTTDAANLFSVSTNGGGSVSFGTSTQSAFVSIASPETRARLWVGTNNQTDFYISENGAIGIGTKKPLSTLSVNGTMDVSGTSEFAGNVRIVSIPDCQGESVLETDSEGNIVCGQDNDTRRSTSPGGSHTQVQYNLNGGFAGSSQFLFDGSSVSIATSSFNATLSIGGSAFLSGGLGVGNATTTDGVLETSGLAYIGGVLKVAGSGTSTIANGLSIAAGGLNFALPSCGILTTDSSGGVVCGTVGGAGGITSFTVAGNAGSNQTISDQNTLTLIGGSNITSTGVDTDIMRFDLDSTLYSMGDIFATSSGASVYASSTLQATGNIIGYSNALFGGTTTPGAVLSVANRAGLTDGKVPLFTVASSTPTATSTLFTILNTGNVGIGTAAPASALDVNGVLTLRPTLSVATIQTNSAESRLDFITNRTVAMNTAFSFQTNGGTRSLDILDNGSVGIGTTAPSDLLHLTTGNLRIGASTDVRATTAGTNQLILFDGTAPVGTLTNGISMYSTAGEAYIMDAAGNATLQSPHDLVTNNWIFDSRNAYTGKTLIVDMELMMKKLNESFGWDFVHETIDGVESVPTISVAERFDLKINSLLPLLSLNIEEDGSLATRIRDYLENSLNGLEKIFVKEVRTDKLCVGETCVTEDQLKALINQSTSTSAPEPSPEPVTDEIEPAPASTPDPEPSPDPEPEQPLVEESTPEPTLEATADSIPPTP